MKIQKSRRNFIKTSRLVTGTVLMGSLPSFAKTSEFILENETRKNSNNNRKESEWINYYRALLKPTNFHFFFNILLIIIIFTAINSCNMKRFKRHKDYGFFDQDIRLSKLSQLGDLLEKLNAGVDFEQFRNLLEMSLCSQPKAPGGRPPYDYVLMLKILILQRYYNLSDEHVEFQINDRMSFMCFLDLTIADDIPDSRTVWAFREQITNSRLVEKLFDLFLRELNSPGLIVNEGKIIDPGFVEVSKQRNSRSDNEQIKKGKTPESFDENPHRKSQKDVDARWVKKNNVNYFGYKNHVKSDAKSKLITKYMVTDASVHDSNATEPLLGENDKGEPFYADSAYTGEPKEEIITRKEMTNQVCEKGYRNKPLTTDEQKSSNTEKSRVRSRVEHIFGFMENSMNGMYINSIGIKRAAAIIGLMNLTYNMYRKIQLLALRGDNYALSAN